MSGVPQHDFGDSTYLTRYLLGGLSEEERERLQAEYLRDPELFDRLVAAEEDLIDAYVRGELGEDDRNRFEERFGKTPAQKQRLHVARMLQTAASPHAAASSRARLKRWLPAAAAVVLVAGAAAFLVRDPDPRATSVQRAPVSSPVATPAGAPATVQSFVLRPGAVRAAGAETSIALNPDGVLELRLALGERPGADYPAYQAVLQTAAGSIVMRRDDLEIERSAAGQFITLRVPASSMERRDYVVLLNGVRDGAVEFLRGYSFSVASVSPQEDDARP